MKKTLAIFGGCLIAAMPVIVLAATVYTLMLPNLYESSVRLSVEPGDAAVECPNPCPHCSLASETFTRTQIEVLSSKPILYEVINRLNLQQQWGRAGDRLPREVAYRILLNSVSVYTVRDTSLLCVSVRRDNPDEAAEIANELAEVYRDSRLNLALNESRKKVDAIGAAMKKQLARVEAAEEQVGGSTEEEARRAASAALEAEQLVCAQLAAKHREEIISLEIPRTPVELIDIAEPDRRPVSPNLFANVLLSIIVAGICGGVGGILLAMGLRKSPPPVR
ncbi:hypothetical protein [Pontiella sp.]|uniref:hypothetical protein n=1 Tax=Pontiella sp. TaxID=2837462 RepID=UPI00356350FC